ncbi:type I restriction-modification system subunit M/S [Nocardia sp. BMG111209]|uniref:N-6 DNA methylase n=1 Tax=Nocardia sp. BMG111209 TaxID=1160137 RepID=UPI0018CBBEB4|nr:type I restriction-modification system subunit M/S [Nocardia sp. BMG111209]
MGNIDTRYTASDVAERIWRAYAPFQQGRDTRDDLVSMFAVMVLARFVQTQAGGPQDESRNRWARAVAEARRGASPLADLQAAMRIADLPVGLADTGPFARHDKDRLNSRGFDDSPWLAPFLTALAVDPAVDEAVLAEVAALLIERYFRESPSTAGEYYTPREVVRLVVDMAALQRDDRILDPACGTGGILAAAARQIAVPGRMGGESFEAHAADRSNIQLATLNLALHGVDLPSVVPTDLAAMFQRPSSALFDRVLSNPPFNQRLGRTDLGAWSFGPPPESSARFAWLQLAWNRLSENGIATIIMPSAAAWSSSAAEEAIRRRMVTHGAVLAIIALPPNLFHQTSIPVHVWILAKDKARHLPAEDRDRILFIDAGEFGTQLPRQPRILAVAETERISSHFRQWLQSPRTNAGKPNFSRSITHKEILENGGNLDPRRYVRDVQGMTPEAQDFSRILDDLGSRDRTLSQSILDLRDTFDDFDQLKPASLENSRVPLSEIWNPKAKQLLAGPSGSLVRAEEYVDTEGIPVVMPKDLTDAGFNTANIRYIAAGHAAKLERFRLRRDDIVLARRGEMGRCAVVGPEQDGWVCGTGCFLLRATDKVNSDYMAAYLRSPSARDWLESRSTGSMNMKTISLNTIGDLPLVLPNLDTQRAIAAVAKQLDSTEQLLREQLEKTREIRHDAVFGLLAAHSAFGGRNRSDRPHRSPEPESAQRLE